MTSLIDYNVIDTNYEKNVLEKITEDGINIKELGVSEVGFNGPKLVTVNGVKGFLKQSSNSTKTLDKFEFILSKLGKYLGIKTADEYLINDDNGLSLFSKSVVTHGQELIMASDVFKEIYYSGKASYEDLRMEKDEEEKYKSTLDAAQLSAGYMASKVDKDNIEYVINMLINRIKYLNAANEEEIIKDFIKMCFFDALIGNKDRNNNNFGLIKQGDNYTFAPLFDSSTISMKTESSEMVDDNLCQVGGYMFNRSELLSHLLTNYKEYLSDVALDQIDEIRDKISVMAEEILSKEDLTWFTDSVLNKLNSNIFDTVKKQTI